MTVSAIDITYGYRRAAANSAHSPEDGSEAPVIPTTGASPFLAWRFYYPLFTGCLARQI
jgi:hypothetical protein